MVSATRHRRRGVERPAWRESTPWTFQLPPPPEWMKRGACVGHDPELWDCYRLAPQQNVGPSMRRALAICRGCAVKRECLERCYEPVGRLHVLPGREGWQAGADRAGVDYSSDSSEFGIWGGTTPMQRHRVRHLPLGLRIEVLLEQVERTGAPLRRLHQAAVEIVERWHLLGRPHEAPARAFHGVVRAYGGATTHRARRALGIRAEPDRRPGSGRVGGWRWTFPKRLTA